VLLKSIIAMKDADTYLPYYYTWETVFGQFAILWSLFKGLPKVMRVIIPGPNRSTKKIIFSYFPQASANSCTAIDNVVDDIKSFLNGEEVKFSLDILYMEICSAFQQKVLKMERRIPKGSVSTYKRIAGRLNGPGGARAVGNALANNPFPIIIPCHRTIRSDGTIGGYGGGVKMKKALLEMEGVLFDNKGYLCKGRFFY